jgi:RNA polymerase sigma-70 factor (ECF subfamily)
VPEDRAGAAPDRDLVATFLERRDEPSFRLLYRRHAPRLYALLLRVTGGRAGEAEEAMQETWARALVALPRFRWDSALSTWLCGIAIRCARELARSAPPAASGPALLAAEKPALRTALAALPRGYREVLLLHDVHGHTHEEIAGMLDIEPGTSKSQLSRARRALRAALPAPARNETEVVR